jgi:hypothetical protein
VSPHRYYNSIIRAPASSSWRKAIYPSIYLSYTHPLFCCGCVARHSFVARKKKTRHFDDHTPPVTPVLPTNRVAPASTYGQPPQPLRHNLWLRRREETSSMIRSLARRGLGVASCITTRPIVASSLPAVVAEKAVFMPGVQHRRVAWEAIILRRSFAR